MEGKKIVVFLALIAVIIVAAVITVKRSRGSPQQPSWVMEQPVEKIDIKSLEVFKESLADWNGKYSPDAAGRFKNPKTGEHSIVGSMTCRACGQPIPIPQLPAELQGKVVDPLVMQGYLDKWQKEYTCPRCGKNPYVAPQR